MKNTIAVAKGDGIGPEIMDAVLRIFKAAKVPVLYKFVDMGKTFYEQGNSSGMSPEAKATIERLGVLFKGPMETPKGKGMKSINVTARKTWNTYANQRIFKTLHGVDTVFSKAGINVDITLVRENLEGTYGGIEQMLTHDVAFCKRFITRPGSLQLHKYAFELARKKGAKKITCGHKANIMKVTDGLFLETFYEVAKDYPDVPANDIIVDDLAMKLVAKPHDFDVLVLTNLQGDILSDLCAGLVGGLGFAPSANIGDNIAIFEAVHGTAPDIAGQNKANPTSLLLSGVMMLRHLGLTASASLIENSLLFTLERGIHTGDFGERNTPSVTTNGFADAIMRNLGKVPAHNASSFASTPDAFDFELPDKLKKNIIRVTPKPADAIVGVDFSVESEAQPAELAKQFQRLVGEQYDLVTVTNRGTQVWRTGSVYTECVNLYTARIEGKNGAALTQPEVLKLAGKVSKKLKICSLEMLMTYDGKKAYSLAQGQ